MLDPGLAGVGGVASFPAELPAPFPVAAVGEAVDQLELELVAASEP